MKTDLKRLINIYLKQATIFKLIGNNKELEILSFEIIELCEKEINDIKGIGIIYGNLGEINKKTKQYKKSEKYFNLSINVFKKINSKFLLAYVNYYLLELYKETKNLKNFKKVYSITNILAKELNNKELLSKLKKLKSRCNDNI